MCRVLFARRRRTQINPQRREHTMGAKKSEGFTAEERAAMRERAKELKAEERASKNRAAGESAVLAAIAEMQGPDRAMV
jgi:hypothetical protein